MKKKIIYLLIFLLALFLGNLVKKGIQSSDMKNSKTFTGTALGSCPNKPNCVSSFNDTNNSNYIKPLAITKLNFSLKDLDLSKFNIIERTDKYIHMTHTSMIFRFIDDIELYFDEDAKLLHFRSASRVGYSDLGANRKRIESIKAQLR